MDFNGFLPSRSEKKRLNICAVKVCGYFIILHVVRVIEALGTKHFILKSSKLYARKRSLYMKNETMKTKMKYKNG